MTQQMETQKAHLQELRNKSRIRLSNKHSTLGKPFPVHLLHAILPQPHHEAYPVGP